MYSYEQDHMAAGRAPFSATGYQPCVAPGSLQLPAHQQHAAGQQVLPAAAAAAAGAATTGQPRRAKSKKHGASSRPSSSSSRRSSTTVVATDVDNFRAMVQELTGFPPAAIFRPLPRRVHAASPFVVGAAAGQPAGCGADERHRDGGSQGSNSSATAGGSDAPAAAQPAVMQPPQCGALGVFDGLADLGSPEFDSWGDLSIE